MSLLGFFQRFKSEHHNLTAVELAHIEGFSKGFDLGLLCASEVDAKMKQTIRDNAIETALMRMNGNHKKDN